MRRLGRLMRISTFIFYEIKAVYLHTVYMIGQFCVFRVCVSNNFYFISSGLQWRRTLLKLKVLQYCDLYMGLQTRLTMFQLVTFFGFTQKHFYTHAHTHTLWHLWYDGSFVLNVWLVVFVVTSFLYFLQEETSAALWSVFQTNITSRKEKKEDKKTHSSSSVLQLTNYNFMQCDCKCLHKENNKKKANNNEPNVAFASSLWVWRCLWNSVWKRCKEITDARFNCSS